MGLKDIFVHVELTVASARRVWVSLALARRPGAQVVDLHMIPNPDLPLYFNPSHAERFAKLYMESGEKQQ